MDILSLMRMTDEELLEYLVGEAEARAVYIEKNNPKNEEEWQIVDEYTDRIENIKGEILRRM